MKYSNIHLIYFSPTHTSAKIVYAIAEGMGATSMSESDVTCESLDMEEYIDDELTIIAAPVYGGRVAETAMERFRMFRSAHHAPVVPVVLYGNRDYEDALKELCDLVWLPERLLASILSAARGCPLPRGVRTSRILIRLRNSGKRLSRSWRRFPAWNACPPWR